MVFCAKQSDLSKIKHLRDFPGGPVVKIQASTARGTGSIPGNVPHDVARKKKVEKNIKH